MPPLLSRRRFLAGAAATVPALLVPPVFGREAARPKIDLAFWHVSDTHFLADATEPSRVDPQSLAVNRKVIELLNALPGTELPGSVGGGKLPAPSGVIHTGDLIDSGDKSGERFAAMQKAELASYAEHYGLTGDDGLLKYPVYELHGNHDSPHGGGLALEVIAGRNKRRPGVTRISPNGLHYSWDWQGVHFVALGIVVGGSKETARRRRYNALGSYDFLVADLKQSVGDGGRPVVICHHVDLARYTGSCDPGAPFEPKNEWDPCDVRAFHEAVRAYNVVAILYGHTHVRRVFRWDGRSVNAATGLDVFNTDDASHFKGPNHGILHFHVTDERMTVREYATKDHWQTAAWTRAWSKPIGVRKA